MASARAHPAAGVGTHSSIKTWALMPPKPKPLTAARRGCPAARAGQGSARVRTRNGLSSSPRLGAGRSKFAVGGSDAVLQGQQHLEQAGGAGRRERVADVRLDRADGALASLPAGFSPERLEALDLDGVAHRGAGGVALDQVDVAGAPAGLLVGHPHGPELALGAGGQQVAVDVVGQADPGHDPVDVIAVAQGVVEPLEDEHPRPFADHQPIGAVVERSGLASCRERAELREPHLGVEGIGARDAAAEHGVGPPGPKLVDGQLEGSKATSRRPRRACRPRPRVPGRGRPARPAARPETRSAARPGRVHSRATPSCSSKTRPRTSRDRAEAVSVGKTMLPKITPTRRRSTSLGPRIAPRLPRRVKREMEDRVEPLEQRSRRGQVPPDRAAAGRRSRRGSSRRGRPGDARVEGFARGRSATAPGGTSLVESTPFANVGPELLERLGAGKEAADAHDRDRVALVPSMWIDRHRSARDNGEVGPSWLRRNAWLSEESTTHS